jgi:hypothetical protein
VLDTQRREMCIIHKIASSANVAEKGAQQRRMSRSRVDDDRLRSAEPTINYV